MSSDRNSTTLQPTCEEYFSDDAAPAKQRRNAKRLIQSETPLPPLSQSVQIPAATTINPHQRLPSNGSDSGYSSRTAATLNSADSLPVKPALSRPNATKPQPQLTKTVSLDVPQKKTSPPTSYKPTPSKRDKSDSKSQREKEEHMRGQYYPGYPPGSYRTPRPAPTPVQTPPVTGYVPTFHYQPTILPQFVPPSPAAVAPPYNNWPTGAMTETPRRRTSSVRPASVSLVTGPSGQWMATTSTPGPLEQSYTLVDLRAIPRYEPGGGYSYDTRTSYSSRSGSRRAIEAAPRSSGSHSRRSTTSEGALVSYGSNPVSDRSVARRRSRSRDHKSRERKKERDYEREYSISDEELDDVPASPRKDALVRTSSRRESVSNSRPTYERLKKSYHQDSYETSRKPDVGLSRRESQVRPSSRHAPASSPIVTSKTTLERTSSRKESSDHRRNKSNESGADAVEDKMREAEKYMQKTSAIRKNSDTKRTIVTTSAQPVSNLTEQLLQQKTKPARRPSESGSQRSQRTAEKSVAGSARTAASQSRTDGSESVKIRLDASKPVNMSFNRPVDFSIQEGMAEFTINSTKGRDRQYSAAGSKSGGSFSSRVSRR